MDCVFEELTILIILFPVFFLNLIKITAVITTRICICLIFFEKKFFFENLLLFSITYLMNKI